MTRKFGNVSVEFKFPKPIITSKMIPLSQENGLLISCVNNKTPLVVYKDGKMATPLLGKNPILPMKPIQRLQSMAESDGVLVLGHGERCLEFGRIRLEEDVIEICRNNQKLGQVSYSVRNVSSCAWWWDVGCI